MMKITSKEYQGHIDDINSIVSDMKKKGRSIEEIERFEQNALHVLKTQCEVVEEIEMTIAEQLDELSDMLGEACFSVIDCIAYKSMTTEQKEQVKEEFYASLKNKNIEITNELIEAAEKEFPTSPMASMLRAYKYFTQGEFKQATEQLTEGRKVTVIKFSDFGFPVVMNTVIEKVTVEPYAQYSESLKIIHKPKRKRSLYSNRILPKDAMLVFDGWLDIDTDSLTSTLVKQDQYVTVKQSKYRSFDKQFFLDALDNIKGQLIVKLNVRRENIK